MDKKVDMFDYFASIADMDISHTEKVGRYGTMKDKEKNIFDDIIEKLKLDDKDNILDIGCGCGTVVYELIDYIQNNKKQLVLNDSLQVLEQIQNDVNKKDNIKFIDGRFPSINLDKDIKFDAIILYSVLHYLDKENIFIFLDSILDRLNNQGLFLIGDIPNMDKRDRFSNSTFGKDFNKKWSENKTTCHITESYPSINLDFFDDDLIYKILSYIRKKDNYNAYLLPQSSKMPFGYIRDDILIEKL